MSGLLEALSGSWFAMGCLKVAAIATLLACLLPLLRQRRFASSVWAVFMTLLPLVFFSGLFPFSWRVLPKPGQAAPAPRINAPEQQVILRIAPELTDSSPETPPLEASEAGELREQPVLPKARTGPSFSRNVRLVMLWAVGGIATLLPGLLSLAAVRQLRLEAVPQDIADLWTELSAARSTKAVIHLSPKLANPGIIGLFSPAVVLPLAAKVWEREQLECVLRHELQHLCRGDLPLRWLGRIARAILWFHPVAWWGQSRLELAQEQAADEAVVEEGISAPAYAGHLLSMATGARSFPGIAMAAKSQVGGRIRVLLSQRQAVGVMRKRMEGMSTLALAVLAPVLSLVGFSGAPEAKAKELAEIADKGFRPPIIDRNGELIATSDPSRMPEELRDNPPIRWYPEGAAAAHLGGYIFKNENGEIGPVKGSGLEDSAGLAEGKMLRSSIDLRIQRLAWEALEKQGLPGAVVVMDPRNGEVLAMVSWPAVDPNLLARGLAREEWDALREDPRRPLQNLAVRAETPASLAKVLVALAAAKENKADRIIHCGPSFMIGAASIRDWNPDRNEDLGLSQALRSSCNTYFVPLALEVGKVPIAGIGKDFGFGQETALPWRGHAVWQGLNAEASENATTDLAFTALGQGRNRFSVLDTARIFSAIAGGQIRPPVFTLGGEEVEPTSLESLGVDRHELAIIQEGLTGNAAMMVREVKENGLGGILAGKSATALEATSKDERSHSAHFACFAPAARPEYVVAVRLGGTPRNDVISGSRTAGPLGVELMRRLLNREF